jgi:AcrR family transcriptional regulator
VRTSARARYLELADQLERELRADGLVGGARVPSTRAIVARFGVAMATASRVLAELAQRGLVRARPGVGTVVTGRVQPGPRTPAEATAVLTRARIVEAGIEIADREGLEAVSMRRVAGELGVAPMALYRHIADKDGLIAHMLDHAYGEWQPPDPAPAAWRGRVEAALRGFWDSCHRHPWVAPATSMTRPQATAGALPFADFLLAALAEVGLSHQDTFTAYLALLNYARGMALTLYAEREQESLTGMDNEAWMDGQEAPLRAALATGDYPTFRRFVSRPYDFDLDTIFEFGLGRLLDGLGPPR